ncbi:MAG TPA: carboxypeptidase-like regulatory domain-containing protein [Vicinamibacterales bacterium]|nr:carboxypeptidase-like regulatory domain-containing protein [Vicinamibacterales bacterium]
MKPSFLLAFLLVLAAPGWAQQSNTTELRIVVVDETNAGIPGATIVVTPQGGEPITFRTDDRGRAISPPLPSGAAAIQIEYPGFEPYAAKLTLRRGAMNQTVTLKIAGLAEEVVVSDTSAEDAIRSSTATTTLTEEEINALPDDPDELRAALEQLAGPGGATFFMNGFRGGRLPTRDEIRAIRIRQNVFSADTHDAGRASIEIITRPSPELSGNLNFGFKDSAWNARNAMARVETPEGEKSATVGLRGPIVRGRTSFRLNGQANSSFQSNTIIAVDQFGNSLGTQVKVPNERTSFTTALEHSLTDRQSLYVEYQRSQTQSSNQGLGAFDLPERAFERENGTNNARFRLQGLIGRTTLHEVRLEFNRQLNEAYSVTEAPAIIVQDAFNMGGAGVHNRRLTQTFELADNLDFSIGRRHQMRVGLLLEGGLYETFDEQNKHGRFVFASLDAFREGRPLQYTQRIGTVDTSFMQYQVGFYWQDDIRVNNRLSIGVGVRNELQSHIDDRLNLMPRIGFTFNPRGNRTAIRGGYGVYYDWYEANLHDQTLRLNGISQTDLLIMNPGYPDPFAGGAQTRVLPGGRTVAAPDLRMPYQHQASVSLERQLRENWNLSVSYQMLRGRNQLRARDINTPIGGVRPNPDAGIITQIESTGRSQTDRVTVQTRFFMPERRLMFNMSYTYGRSLSHSNGPTALPSDSLNPDIDWGPSGQDIRHQLQAQAMLPLPLGFRANLQFRAQSGPAYNLTTGRDDNLDGVVNDRPAGVPRNSLRGDGYWNLTNIRLSKNIGFGGSRTGGPAAGGPQGVPPTAGGGGALLAQRGGPGGGRGGGGFRGDEAFNSRYSVEIFVNATNPLNRVIPVGYSGNILSPFFGRATNVQPARRVDFGLALRF